MRLDEVVLRALQREPEKRYQQASEVRTDIESLAEAAPATPAPEPTSSASRRRPDAQAQAYVRAPASLLIVMAILNLVVLVALLGLAAAEATGPGRDAAVWAFIFAALLVVNVPLSGVMWLGAARLLGEAGLLALRAARPKRQVARPEHGCDGRGW